MKNIVSRRTAMGLGAALIAAPNLISGLVSRSGAAPLKKQPVLIELFTSQGCSSCPPADALAGELAQREDVIPVSLNVDYWDYLGWRDTLAKPDYSKRQRDYAAARGDGDVYTPQMVANGALHAVGSSRSNVDAMIAKARDLQGTVAIELDGSDKELRITVADGALADATVWVMSIAPHVDVKIRRGENTGRTVVYHNVVRTLVPAGMWKGQQATFTLPKSAIITPDCKSCLVVLQEGTVGRVLGLAHTTLAQS